MRSESDINFSSRRVREGLREERGDVAAALWLATKEVKNSCSPEG